MHARMWSDRNEAQDRILKKKKLSPVCCGAILTNDFRVHLIPFNFKTSNLLVTQNTWTQEKGRNKRRVIRTDTSKMLITYTSRAPCYILCLVSKCSSQQFVFRRIHYVFKMIKSDYCFKI